MGIIRMFPTLAASDENPRVYVGGETHISTTAGTTLTDQSVWYDLAGTWSAPQLDQFSHSGGEFTYEGWETRKFLACFGGTVTGTSNGIHYWGFSINGASPADEHTSAGRVAGSSAVVSGHSMVTLEPGQALKMMLQHTTAAGGLTTVGLFFRFGLYGI